MATLTLVGSIRLRRWALPKLNLTKGVTVEMFALPSHQVQRRWFRVFFLLCFLGIVSLRTQATTFVVTKAADTQDGNCNADCSLREAIIAANNNGASADIITFANFGGVISPTSPLPSIQTSLTIDGGL